MKSNEGSKEGVAPTDKGSLLQAKKERQGSHFDFSGSAEEGVKGGDQGSYGHIDGTGGAGKNVTPNERQLARDVTTRIDRRVKQQLS